MHSIARHILLTTLAVSFSLVLAGCGQKGPLLIEEQTHTGDTPTENSQQTVH